VKTIDLDNLPGDVSLLQELVRTLAEALELKDTEIAALKHRLAVLLRGQFGPRSERVDPGQLELAVFAALREAAASAPEPPPVPPAPGPSKKNGHGRRVLPRELPRVRVEYTLAPEAQVCPKCGGGLKQIGEEVSKQTDYQPATFFIREHARAKYACPCCQESVVVAPMPQQPIDKGLPGPGLLSYVVVSKFQDHLPLNRQEHILKRQGLEFARSTTCDWLRATAKLLEPIVNEMATRLLESRVLHTDDTPVPVRDHAVKGRTRTGRLWVYLGDEEHPYTVYDYTPTREKKWPEAFLAGWRGTLQADAYAGYDAMFALPDILEAACWAHARRKFYDARATDGPRAAVALAFIARLYRVETEAREGGLDAEGRRLLRQAKARPMLEELRTWLLGVVGAVPPKSPLGEAIGYALDQWVALTRYLDNGALDIDNNAAERALRGVAVGRKNWLFAGSDAGGRRAAIFYSLIETAKRHGVDPFAYLRDVIGRVSTHPARDIAALLPPHWKKAQEALSCQSVVVPSAPTTPPDTS
jgi:transposase